MPPMTDDYVMMLRYFSQAEMLSLPPRYVDTITKEERDEMIEKI